jgi:hypothetical protein
MAGFEVITYGRFWVIAKANGHGGAVGIHLELDTMVPKLRGKSREKPGIDAMHER